MNASILTRQQGQINLLEDLCPLSDFRADTAGMISKVRESCRPLALTQHGKCTAVVISTESYQALIEKLGLLEDIILGQHDVINGDVFDHADVKKRILSRFKK